MIVDDIRSQLLSIREVSDWPEMRRLLDRATDPDSLPVWEYPVFACQAAGGSKEQALPGATAIFCTLYSVHLVDDMLDRDPEGLYHRLGEGTAANLALSFQAAGSKVVAQAGLNPKAEAAIHASLAEAALATAFGQNLDLSDLRGEEDYWRVVESKTPPLFSAALHIGALLADASPEVAASFQELGFLLGRGIQVSDDLKDALEKPARPDWHRKWNNLPILYAMTAEHAEKERFIELLAQIEEPEALASAQDILVSSGAVSFCTYHMVEMHRRSLELLAAIPLHDHGPMNKLLEYLIGPLKGLFKTIGVDAPEELFA